MSMLKLADKIAQFDPYGISRMNGFKAVFLTELLFGFNAIFSIPTPYFYYFFVPLNMILAENLGTNLLEKYGYFIFAMMTSIGGIFWFHLLSTYKLLFLVFVFIYSISLYYFLLSKLKKILLLAPLMLSMANYSNQYQLTHDFYVELNHILIGVLAMVIILIGLWLFPKYYYLRIWRRAFVLHMKFIQSMVLQIQNHALQEVPHSASILIMKQYAQMLPYHMNFFSVLKINHLNFDLLMQFAAHVLIQPIFLASELEAIHRATTYFIQSATHKKTVDMEPGLIKMLQECPNLYLIKQIKNSWDYLCADSSLQRS